MGTTTTSIGACGCCGIANCSCPCAAPAEVPDGFWGAVPGDFNLPCFFPPGPGHGWNWSWCELTPGNSWTLDRCASPFPGAPEVLDYDCDGMRGPWKNDPGDGCDDSWIIPEGVARYAGCQIKVLCGYSSKMVLAGPQVSAEGHCDCYWHLSGEIRRYEIYAKDCDAGEHGGWKRITSEVLQRNEHRECWGDKYIFDNADCGIEKPALSFFEFTDPPDLYPCVNDFP
jgi:hypothetical protein